MINLRSCKSALAPETTHVWVKHCNIHVPYPARGSGADLQSKSLLLHCILLAKEDFL